jgi:hypothetical protein
MLSPPKRSADFDIMTESRSAPKRIVVEKNDYGNAERGIRQKH